MLAMAQNRNLDANMLVCDSTEKIIVLPNLIVDNSISNVKYIHNSASNLMVLKTDSTIWMRGSNTYGQLGNGTYSFSSNFVQVSNLQKIVEISMSNQSAAALRNDGKVFVWGANALNFTSTGNGHSNVPVMISNLSNVKHIVMAYKMLFVLKNDSTVWAIDTTGMIKKINGMLQIVQIAGLDNVPVVAALDVNGKVWVWGKDATGYPHSDVSNPTIFTLYLTGYYGNGKINNSDTLIHYVLNNAKSIREIGNSFACIKKDGSVWLWGGVSFNRQPIYPLFPTINRVINSDTLIEEWSNMYYYSMYDDVIYAYALKKDGSVWKEMQASTSFTNEPLSYQYVLIHSKPCAVASVRYNIFSSSHSHLFPNPTSSLIHLQLPARMENSYKIKITNLFGQVLSLPVQKISDNMLSVDFSNVPEGVYVLQYSDNQGNVFTNKVVVKR
jgi:alpha-tubulin suppressor-like RCC1 family protein